MSEANKYVSMIYGNVTTMGKKVWSYIVKTFRTQPRVMGFAAVEAHIKDEAIHGTAWWKQRCRKAGLKLYANAARSTGPKARQCKGGEWFMIRNNRAVTSLDGLKPPKQQHKEMVAAQGAGFECYEALNLHLKRSNLVVILLYLTSSSGLDLGNKRRLASVSALVATLKDPWLILGDWNLPPSELESSGWLEKIQGELVLPHGVEFTCSTGTSNTLLDFGVRSKSADSIVQGLFPVTEVPWGTHLGLELRLNPSLEKQKMIEWNYPRAFPPVEQPKKAADPNSRTAIKKAARALASKERRDRRVEKGLPSDEEDVFGFDMDLPPEDLHFNLDEPFQAEDDDLWDYNPWDTEAGDGAVQAAPAASGVTSLEIGSQGQEAIGMSGEFGVLAPQGQGCKHGLHTPLGNGVGPGVGLGGDAGDGAYAAAPAIFGDLTLGDTLRDAAGDGASQAAPAGALTTTRDAAGDGDS